MPYTQLLTAPAASLAAGEVLGIALRVLILAAVLTISLRRRDLLAGRPAFRLILQLSFIPVLAVALVGLVVGLFLAILPLPFMDLLGLVLSLAAGYVALNALISKHFDLDLDYAHQLTMEIGITTVLLWLIAGAVIMLSTRAPG